MFTKLKIILLMTPGIVIGWVTMNIGLIFKGVSFEYIAFINRAYCEAMDGIYEELYESRPLRKEDAEIILRKHSEKFYEKIR